MCNMVIQFKPSNRKPRTLSILERERIILGLGQKTLNYDVNWFSVILQNHLKVLKSILYKLF